MLPLERGAGEVAILAVAHRRARGADDGKIGREQPVGIERKQARQQHALGKVAGGSEQQQAVSGEAHAQVAPCSVAPYLGAGRYNCQRRAYLFKPDGAQTLQNRR
jgi:hypothetical protein